MANKVFEVLFRSLAFSFFATAVYVAGAGIDLYVLKVAGCLAASFFWFLAENQREQRALPHRSQR